MSDDYMFHKDGCFCECEISFRLDMSRDAHFSSEVTNLRADKVALIEMLRRVHEYLTAYGVSFPIGDRLADRINALLARMG